MMQSAEKYSDMWMTALMPHFSPANSETYNDLHHGTR